MMMNTNISWDKFMLERSESKESFFRLKKKKQQQNNKWNRTPPSLDQLRQSYSFFSYFLFMSINIRWDKFMLKRSDSKESFFCLKQKQQRKKWKNTSFTWLTETKLFFFLIFFIHIIFLKSEYGDYLKPFLFQSIPFQFNISFPL